MRPDQLERHLRERLNALGPAPRAELLHVLMLPDLERADRIAEFWSCPPRSPAARSRFASHGHGLQSSTQDWLVAVEVHTVPGPDLFKNAT